MFDYLEGSLAEKDPAFVVLDVGGIGYRLHISLNTFSKIEKEERARLLVYYYVNQQDYVPALYGFAERRERDMFVHLVSVSGISVHSARMILSSMSPGDVRRAILSEEEQAFRSVKGIGTKTAKRIILDLRDKLVREGVPEEEGTESSLAGNMLHDQALSALVALQFNKGQARKVLQSVQKDHPEVDTVEQLIRLALQQLNR